MTLKELVLPLGISTKTVYRFFDDKEQLLKECLLLHYKRNFAILDKLEESTSNPVVKIYTIWQKALEADFGTNKIFYHDLNHYYPHLQDAVIARQAKKITSVITGILQKGIDQGYFRKNLRPEIVLKTMSLIYNLITRTHEFRHFNPSPEMLAFHTTETYLRGICTTKGLFELELIYHNKK